MLTNVTRVIALFFKNCCYLFGATISEHSLVISVDNSVNQLLLNINLKLIIIACLHALFILVLLYPLPTVIDMRYYSQ